jgi:squalene-hopene/tetraprenyl-beta-curcumene cyclase
MNKEQLEVRFRELSGRLLEEMNGAGYWTGELSSSALGVAVAVAALHFDDRQANAQEISAGLRWLVHTINADGSYGDTPQSPGNISTTLLVYAAVNLYASGHADLASLLKRMGGYLMENSIDPRSEKVAEAILRHYKKDYTFSVPILTMCALCGIPGEHGFKNIPQLPFELSLLPGKFYRLLNLSVVSYAIPALVAVGIVIFKKKKPGWLLNRIRQRSVKKALVILERMMPESGGFLEAIPLTAFVALSLVNSGYRDHTVVRKGIDFLKNTQREDGSWPIDIDLSTWVTTLSVKSLRTGVDRVLPATGKETLARHLLSIQNRRVHPFNDTGPGGWGWTSYPGSVPDCDDTPGVILALLRLLPAEKIRQEVLAGCNWLFSLQNKDGGFPTFSRGWGKLPFDSSCADLTGHCLLALTTAWKHYGDSCSAREKKAFQRSIREAASYLKDNQRQDGSWLPLWFGNQLTPGHLNPVYGTARVLTYLLDMKPYQKQSPDHLSLLASMAESGTRYLLSVQNPDGSWGGAKNIPGTAEETALALSALVSNGLTGEVKRGFEWLEAFIAREGLKPAPIGLYFASLWYDEKMYPITACLEAVARALEEPQ